MKKLPPGIDLLPSGKYRARVRVHGRQKSKSFTNRRDAEKWRHAQLVANETGQVAQVDADLMPFWKLAAEHMAAEGANWEPSTKELYNGFWQAHVKPHPLRDMPLRAITPAVIEDWRDERLAADAGVEAVRKTMKLCHGIHERAVRHGLVSSNPWKVVKKPKAAKAKKVKVISPEGVEAIRAQLDGAHAVFVSVVAYGGLRPGEGRALRWGDISARNIHVHEGSNADGSGKSTKTGESRPVRLVAPLAEDLAAWRAASGNPPDSAYVFARADGRAWTNSDYVNFRARNFKSAVEKAGVDIDRIYDLRHSAASLWLHEGISPIYVATWMGHSVAMLSKTYAHVIADVDPDDKTPAVEMIRKARKAHDTPVTHLAVKRRQAGVKRSAA